jgi:energy-coupling factor transporter ATP-binding protein EcfA2
MSRFRDFINGALADAANVAETELRDAIDDLPNFGCLSASDWEARLAQVGKRDTELASKLTAFREAVQTRREAALAVLEAGLITPTGALASPKAELVSLVAKLTAEAAEFSKGDDAIQRQNLVEERNELIDQRLLSTNREQLVKRRDLLKEDALFVAALAEVQTKAITTKANELVDVHLTASVMAQYNAERTELEVAHLKVGLARKSGQTRATFQAVPGTSITKLSSEILSEGEQRALALASFLTEVGSNAGSAPIIIDDPVSSLDRERGLKVAARIAKEAKVRQVVVFTHDLIFFNDLCKEADEAGIPTETVALFSDGANSGKVDPAGVSWKGLAVAKRLKRIRDDFIPVKPLHKTSPADYEFKVKNLYGRLRDAYERLVEEHIFCDVVRRGVDRIETLKLRLVHLTDALAVRFHDGMTKANTHSHDNPASATVKVPEPAEFEGDLAFIEQLIADLKAESAKAESNRPSMKPQKA